MDPAGIEARWQEAKRAMGRGDFATVREACAAVLAASPGHARAHNFAGLADIALGDEGRGLENLQHSVQLEPGNAALWLNLGAGFMNLERPGEAYAAYLQAERISPGAPSTRGKASCLLGLGRWREARDLLDGLPWGDPTLDDIRLFSLAYDASCTPEAFRATHEAWGARFPARERPSLRQPRVDRPLRVGFVSPDFRNHSCAYFLEAIWAHRDPAQVQLFAYAEYPMEDAWTIRFRQGADNWRPTYSLSDASLAAQIGSDGIDILVDLAGHTHGNRLRVFALRPAPIQLTWLGYPGTTGLRTFDGRMTDAVADPPGSEDHSTEPLLRLPHFLCYTPGRDTPQPGDPPSRSGEPPTFGCFNTPAKLNDRVFDLWSRLLERKPGSRLLLKGKSLHQSSAQEYFRNAFVTRGIDQDRIVFLGWIPDGQSPLAAYQSVDVALDPFPYNGTTTTCEALWMGVPVVTLRGDRHAGRVGASLLSAAGLPDWIAESEEDYLRIATDLVADPAVLAVHRQGLRARLADSPLLDGPGFVRNLESTLRRLWVELLQQEGR